MMTLGRARRAIDARGAWPRRRPSDRLRAVRARQQSGVAARCVMTAAMTALVTVVTSCAHGADARAFGIDGIARPEASLDSVPWLRERVLGSAYSYFRFVNAIFVAETCRRLGSTLRGAQRVNLHGDAHVEQFAITETGRGLNDFDDSVKGPAAVDLVRFSTSLRLMASEHQWPVDDALDQFFAGYRKALADPSFRGPEPAVVARVRARFHDDPAVYFTQLAAVMEPIEEPETTKLFAAMEPYVAVLRATRPDLGPDYFTVRSAGRTHVGIGSARSHKYLVRIEGLTSALEDDEVLELKEVGEVARGTCVEPGSALDPMRPIVGQARIGYEPYRLAGYVTIDEKPFWVHAWARNYVEVSGEELKTAGDLAEVAFDAGVQLGLGHPRYIEAPFEAETRARELLVIGKVEAAARLLSKQLADEITASWKRAVAAYYE